MSNAWETTSEDVQNACANNNYYISEDMAEKLLGKLDHDAIEKAALYGNDMDEQTNNAYDEIRRQISTLEHNKKVRQ